MQTITLRGNVATLSTALSIAIDAWRKDADQMRESATECGNAVVAASGFRRLAEQFDRQIEEGLALADQVEAAS